MSGTESASGADPYQLAIRPPAAAPPASAEGRSGTGSTRAETEDATAAADTSLLQDRLRRVPQVVALEPSRYEFGGRDPHGVMEVQLAANEVRVTIPRGWVPGRGPQVFALVFMMAEWLGWQVHDLQIGTILNKDTVLAGLVAMRQAQLEAQGARVPQPRVRGDPGRS